MERVKRGLTKVNHTESGDHSHKNQVQKELVPVCLALLQLSDQDTLVKELSDLWPPKELVFQLLLVSLDEFELLQDSELPRRL